MPYAANRICCDVGSHIMETGEWVARHADAQIRERLPGLNLAKSSAKSCDFIHEALARQRARRTGGACEQTR